MANIVLNLFDKLFDTFEGSTSDSPLRDDVEPDLDLIEPRRRGWGIVNVPAGMSYKPPFHLRMLVSGVVVNHDMYIEIRRNILVHMLQKAQIFLMTMSAFAFGNYLSPGDIQCSKKRCRAMTLIVVGNSLDVSESHGQHRLSAIQRLDLAFFIHAENYCLVGRIQVEPDNIADFFHKEWIGRKLEMPLPVRLKSKHMPNAANRLEGNTPCLFRKSANRPLGTIFGLGVECFPNDQGHFFVSNGAWSPGAEFLMQPLDTQFQKTCSPFPHRGLTHA